MADQTTWWTSDQVLDFLAEATGKRPSRNTWSGYVSRGQAPQPGDHVGRTPRWDADVVRAWQSERRGQGWRGQASPPSVLR